MLTVALAGVTVIVGAVVSFTDVTLNVCVTVLKFVVSDGVNVTVIVVALVVYVFPLYVIVDATPELVAVILLDAPPVIVTFVVFPLTAVNVPDTLVLDVVVAVNVPVEFKFTAALVGLNEIVGVTLFIVKLPALEIL